MINRSADGCWSEEVINTANEEEAKKMWEEVKNTAKSFWDQDRNYDRSTQFHYNVTEWDFSKENDGEYEGIENVTILRIYEDEDDYLSNVDEEDIEECRKTYWENVEYLKNLTNADAVVFGNR